MRDTKGRGEGTSPLFRGDSLPKAGAIGAEPLWKCPVSGPKYSAFFLTQDTRARLKQDLADFEPGLRTRMKSQ